MDATPAWIDASSWSSASAGVFHPSALRGLPLSVTATAWRSSALQRKDHCPLESIGAVARWTLLCLSSGVGEAVQRGGCAGGGLDAAVEPWGEGALEAAADVSMRLALGDGFGFVGRDSSWQRSRVIATVWRA